MTKIYNGHDQVAAAVEAGVIDKKQAVLLAYEPQGRGAFSGWYLQSPFYWPHPNKEKAAWQDKVARSWHLPTARLGQRADLLEARRIASEATGVQEWKRNRIGQYVPAEVQKAFPIPKEES